LIDQPDMCFAASVSLACKDFWWEILCDLDPRTKWSGPAECHSSLNCKRAQS